MTPSAPRRVLLAEDEALIRLDLKEMLEEEGYEVVAEADEGESAVRLAQELRPDLVILDVKMPGVDGLEAAQRIAAERLAPVIILTAFSQRELIERARDAGAMAYLIKPFQKRDLLPAIELAMSRHAEIVGLERETHDLTERLAARKLVERAKGLLQTQHAMTEPAAFRWVQRASMDRRTTMSAVARDVLDGRLAPQPDQPQPNQPPSDQHQLSQSQLDQPQPNQPRPGPPLAGPALSASRPAGPRQAGREQIGGGAGSSR